jgi:phenylacetate-CoA ligase
MSSYQRRLGYVLEGLAVRSSLARRESWPRERLLALQQARLSHLVRHAAARAPFWGEHLAGRVPPAGPVDLAALPAVTKDVLMDRFEDALTVSDLSRAEIEGHLAGIGAADELLHGRYRVMVSGGSSGRRGIYVYGPADWRRMLRGVFRCTQLIGISPALPRRRVASVSAPDAKHMTFRAAASVDAGIFRTLRLPATLGIDELVARLEAFQPEFLFAYASMAALLAQEQLAGRLHLRLRGVCTTSELRTPDMTERIRAAFGVTPFDCYATTETGIAAVDCGEHAGLHVFEDSCILEVVDAAGRPVPDGEAGERLLVTNLVNLTQPMIRVAIEDLVAITSEPCACGRTLRRMVSLAGRADDLLVLPGRGGPVTVHPIRLRSALAALGGLAEYQIVQRPDDLELRMVVAPGADPAALARDAASCLAHALATAGVQGCPVVVTSRARLDRGSGAAKLKVVRSLPSEGR